MKCKFCFSKLSERDTACSVCGIAAGKDKKELTKEEKRRRYFCHAIRVTGLLVLIASAFWLSIALLFLVMSFRQDFQLGLALAAITPLVAGVFLWILGLALRSYKRWAFWGAIAVLGIMIVLNALALNVFKLLIPLLLLYYVVNRESRAIFFRNVASGSGE